MASPLEIYTEWQRRQNAQEFEQLGEVVDLEGFRDICIGLSDWTTGYQAAFENLTRNILTPFADLQMTVEEMIEGQEAVVVRLHVEGTQVSDFLGVPATMTKGLRAASARSCVSSSPACNLWWSRAPC